MESQTRFQTGMTVYGADNEKVGKISAVDSGYIVVEKGFFFPSDYYIPTSAVANVDGDDIYLNVTKDQALSEQSWADAPVGGTYATTETTGYATDTAEYVEPTGYATETTGYTDRAQAAVSVDDRDEIRVPVYEEDLNAVKREVERGAVRIEKDVVVEDRVVEVPLTEERVRVSRVEGGSGVVGDTTHAFEEGVIEVPLRGQEVELEKTARVAGEVVVEKEAVQRTERVGGTVRREEVRVDDLEGGSSTEFMDDSTSGSNTRSR